MPVNPQVEELLETIEESGAPQLESLPIPEARQLAAGYAAMGINAEPIPHVEDLPIPGSGAIAARIYRSTEVHARRPVLVYLHGSGWMYGDLDMSDSICRRLASVSGCVVVAPDYRLAPEYPYPAALDDTCDVLVWLYEHAAEIGGDRNRLAIGGESAGANLAAAAALRIRDLEGPPLLFQLLVCPITDHDFDRTSYLEYRDGYLLTRAGMQWLWDMYAPDRSTRDSPYVSPLLAEDLSGLPPALVMTAEFDPLRDEAEAYAARLGTAGVSVELRRYDGLVHGFMTLAGVIDAGRQAIDVAAHAVCRALAAAEQSPA